MLPIIGNGSKGAIRKFIDNIVIDITRLKDQIKGIIAPYFNNLIYYSSRIQTRNQFVCDFDIGVDGHFLISTKRGLYEIQNKKLFLIVKGEFYGLACLDDSVYLFQRLANKGRLLEFVRDKNVGFNEYHIFMNRQSPGCHQIDIYQGILYVCDTYNNRILKIDPYTKTHLDTFYPLGRLENGRNSINYGHINSIFLEDNKVFLVCHNHTRTTNRNSQVLVLDHNFSIKETINTSCDSAHNVIPYNNSFIICDSINGSLKLGDKIVFEAKCFTRGVCVTEDYILLGGSEYAERSKRENTEGYLFVLNKSNFKLINKTNFPGMVQEIRRLDSLDIGSSLA